MVASYTSGNIPAPPPGSPHEHMSKLDREGTAYTVDVMSLDGSFLLDDVAVCYHNEKWLRTQFSSRIKSDKSTSRWFPMDKITITIHEQ